MLEKLYELFENCTAVSFLIESPVMSDVIHCDRIECFYKTDYRVILEYDDDILALKTTGRCEEHDDELIVYYEYGTRLTISWEV